MHRAAQHRQQRRHRALMSHRQLLARHRDRYPHREQGPAQRRQCPRGGAHQHRHVRPGHPLQQVSSAELVSHPGCLGRGGAEYPDADLPGRLLPRPVLAGTRAG